MYVPVWLLVTVALLIAVLALLAFRRRGSGEMIADQRRAMLTPQVRPPRGALVDEFALMARPEVRAALQQGNKIEAIKQVRAASGLALREAKELVERHAPR